MTAPRLRERRRPPRRSGGSSSHTYAVSANGSARPSGHGALRRAAAALLVLLAVTAAFAPAARAQEATALQATMTVGLGSQDGVGGYLVQQLGYDQTNSIGNLSPMQFNYPASSAGESPAYTVNEIYLTQEGNPSSVDGINVTAFQFSVRGAVTTSATDLGVDLSHVLPKDVDFTLHLARSDWSRSYSLKNVSDRALSSPPGAEPWQVGDVVNEFLTWDSDFPPLVEDETVTVRLTHPPTTAPPPPTNLTASPGDRRVTLAWDATAAAAGISRHEFRYKWRTTGDYIPWQAIPDSAPGGGNASGYTPPGASDDYPATGYPNLIDHVFQVRAVNAAGESGPSNEAAVTPLDPKAPPAPTVSAPANTAGLLAVSWTAVASASAYEVRYWPADEDGRSFRTRRTRDTSALIRPLAADTEYRVSVAAREAGNRGPWSEVATARTGAQQASKPIMSLQVVDGSGNDIVTVTAGGTFRYRIKLADIRNHHLTFDGGSDPDYDSEHHGWGTLGIRGVWAMDFVLDGDPEGSKLTCESESLFLRDFVETSPTEGYWEFESPGLPLYADERGPLRLRLGFKCTGRHNGASTEIDTDDDGVFDIVEESPPSDGVVDTTSEALLRLGRPNRACLSVANDLGMVTNACGSGEAGARALTAQFESAPAQHDGRKRIKVRVAFSEAPENVDADGVRVEGGRVTSSKRVGGSPQGDAQGRSAPRAPRGAADREVVWEFEIEPDSDGDLTVTLEAGRPCGEPGAICTADGRALSEGISTTVEGPEAGPPPLTASFRGHAGGA